MAEKALQTRARFARLLNEFSPVAVKSRQPFAQFTTQLRALLQQFGEHYARAEAMDEVQSGKDHVRIRALLAGYGESLERHRQAQEERADDFNLLDVLRLTGKEIRHSMVLAWLLDHDMRRLGTHAQGNLGFRQFLMQIGLPIAYADINYWVRREVAGDESIVDIEVGCRGQFLIHIENKIWSSEGTEQTDREWGDLQRRAADLKVSASQVHALFLTPHGASPGNRNFQAISWGRIVNVLDKFALHAKPLDVKLFAAHYARALRRFIVVQNQNEAENGEGIDERRGTISR